jgi:1-acyl-sn-glycerol-3-phosphate acyltransferase
VSSQPFQKGAFLIAQQAGVRIVPLSLSHTGEVMPTDALFPLCPAFGYTRIHINPPIEVEGKDIKQLMREVRTS